MSDTKKYKYNAKPRLSASQLSEYSTATPPRRTAIIADAKYPKTTVVTRYRDLRKALKKHLTDPTQSHHILSNAILAFQEKQDDLSASTWVKEDCRASMEAITKFQKSANTLGIKKYTFEKATIKFPPILLEGVKLSIIPDVLVRKSGAANKNSVGGALLMFSKSEKSPEKRKNRGKVAAILMLKSLNRFQDTLGIPDPKLCMVIDVYEGKVYDASTGITRLSNGLDHSCREVFRAWDDVDPPSDY